MPTFFTASIGVEMLRPTLRLSRSVLGSVFSKIMFDYMLTDWSYEVSFWGHIELFTMTFYSHLIRSFSFVQICTDSECIEFNCMEFGSKKFANLLGAVGTFVAFCTFAVHSLRNSPTFYSLLRLDGSSRTVPLIFFGEITFRLN